MITVYKIRRKSDGLFSMGGSAPIWSKLGKTWKTKGQVKASITCHKKYIEEEQRRDERLNGPNCRFHESYYKDCEIVEYEMAERASEEIK
jgi:hypothetical protein